MCRPCPHLLSCPDSCLPLCVTRGTPTIPPLGLMLWMVNPGVLPQPVIQDPAYTGSGLPFQPLFIHPHPSLSSFHTHSITGHPENPVGTEPSASVSAWNTLPISLCSSSPRWHISSSDVMYGAGRGVGREEIKRVGSVLQVSLRNCNKYSKDSSLESTPCLPSTLWKPWL